MKQSITVKRVPSMNDREYEVTKTMNFLDHSPGDRLTKEELQSLIESEVAVTVAK